MPIRLAMKFDNNPYSNAAVVAYLSKMKKNEVDHNKRLGAKTALNGSMIGRIFYAKPGCGSCGK